MKFRTYDQHGVQERKNQQFTDRTISTQTKYYLDPPTSPFIVILLFNHSFIAVLDPPTHPFTFNFLFRRTKCFNFLRKLACHKFQGRLFQMDAPL